MYKRQANYDAEATGRLLFIFIKEVAEKHGAVSYTHLDVYKRQVWLKLTAHSHTSVGKIKILRALKKRLKIRKLDEESKILGELIYFPSF